MEPCSSLPWKLGVPLEWVTAAMLGQYVLGGGVSLRCRKQPGSRSLPRLAEPKVPLVGLTPLRLMWTKSGGVYSLGAVCANKAKQNSVRGVGTGLLLLVWALPLYLGCLGLPWHCHSKWKGCFVQQSRS